jgi:outer membrane immunogenic protein
MKKILIPSVVFGTLVAGTAVAADLAVKAPLMKAPPPSAYTWTGCYVNAGAGYGLFDQKHNISSGAFATIDTTTSGQGWLGRFGGGCDYQLTGTAYSNFVIGGFADYDWMNLTGTLSTQLINATFLAPTQADEKESSAWSVGGRIGYVIAPMVLGYVDGGWTQTHFDQMNLVTITGIPVGNSFPAHTYEGWFLGSGFDYNFSWLPIPGLFLRTEYRYASYGRGDLAEFHQPTGLATGFVLHAQKNVQTVTTSLVWRFNWFGGAPVMTRY